jgi:hypothetical protein
VGFQEGLPAPGVGRSVVGYAVDGVTVGDWVLVGFAVDGRGVGTPALYVGEAVGVALGLCFRKNLTCSGVMLSTGK